MKGFVAGLLAGLALAGVGLAAWISWSALAAPHPQAAEVNRPAEIVLVVSETFVQQQIEQALGAEAGTLKPQMDLRPPALAVLQVSTEVDGLGVIRPEVTLQLAIDEGNVVLATQDYQVQGLPIPRSLLPAEVSLLEADLERQLNLALRQQLQPWHLRLLSISATETELAIRAGQ